jgi:hypothetical protein
VCIRTSTSSSAVYMLICTCNPDMQISRQNGSAGAISTAHLATANRTIMENGLMKDDTAAATAARDDDSNLYCARPRRWWNQLSPTTRMILLIHVSIISGFLIGCNNPSIAHEDVRGDDSLNPTNGQTHTQGAILTDPIVSHTGVSPTQS